MTKTLSPAQISEIVEMALSDHISFAQISAQHGVTPDEIKALMRTQLERLSIILGHIRMS